MVTSMELAVHKDMFIMLLHYIGASKASLWTTVSERKRGNQ